MSNCCNGDSSIEANPMSTCGCTSTPCGCGIVSTKCTCSNCTPSYKNVVLCQEDNKITEYVYAIMGSITSVQSFSMPACAGTVTVEFDHICNVAIGTWLWAEGVGYLEVTASSTAGRTLTLKNICPGGYGDQADAGASVPVGTQFVLGQPQLLGTDNSTLNSELYPYLNSGFVAPANAGCVQIAVTNVNGLAVGKNVSILTGTYRIDSIDSPVLITICNDGDGLTAGTAVDYKDVLGNFLVPIVLIDNNPCTNPTILAGKVLACVGGVTSPLVGNANGQLLVYDHGTGNANFRNLGIPVVDCVELTADLTLDNTLPSGTDYVVYVSDTSGFIATDIVLIGGTEFEVDTVINGTTFRLRPLVDPSAVQTYNAGTTLCGASCCELLDTRVDRLELWVYSNDNDPGGARYIDSKLYEDDSVPLGSTPLVTTLAGNLAEVQVVNQSGLFPMKVFFGVNINAQYLINGVAGKYAAITTDVEAGGAAGLVAPAPGTLVSIPKVYGIYGASGSNAYGEAFTWYAQATIPPVSTFTFAARVRATLGLFDAASVDAVLLNTRVIAFGTAVGA